MHMRNTLVIPLAAAISLSFVACNRGSSSPTESSSPQAMAAKSLAGDPATLASHCNGNGNGNGHGHDGGGTGGGGGPTTGTGTLQIQPDAWNLNMDHAPGTTPAL